jgi:hypothetical protein
MYPKGNASSDLGLRSSQSAPYCGAKAGGSAAGSVVKGRGPGEEPRRISVKPDAARGKAKRPRSSTPPLSSPTEGPVWPCLSDTHTAPVGQDGHPTETQWDVAAFSPSRAEDIYLKP